MSELEGLSDLATAVLRPLPRSERRAGSVPNPQTQSAPARNPGTRT